MYLRSETEMPEKTNPFNELNTEDQKCAIDVAIAALLIGTRLPSVDKALYDYLVTEFSRSLTLPANLAKYALRSLGRTLALQNWTLTISKDGEGIVTAFKPEPVNNNQES
jgi:hypothetical protein